MAKVCGSIKSSSDIMKMMNDMTRVPEMRATMMEMSREMMKAGIMEEMMDDTLSALDDEDLEEEADDEVNKVLSEITKGVLGQMSSVPTTGGAAASRGKQPAAAEEENEDDMRDLKSRLDALQSI